MLVLVLVGADGSRSRTREINVIEDRLVDLGFGKIGRVGGGDGPVGLEGDVDILAIVVDDVDGNGWWGGEDRCGGLDGCTGWWGNDRDGRWCWHWYGCWCRCRLYHRSNSSRSSPRSRVGIGQLRLCHRECIDCQDLPAQFTQCGPLTRFEGEQSLKDMVGGVRDG